MQSRKADLNEKEQGGEGSGTMQKQKFFSVDVIKAVSCIMIFLYHCNTILPGEWKFLTLFGQDLGNNLFFMVSGFALAPSIDHTPLNRFHCWYAKRLIRILPITMIAYILTYLRGYFSFRDPAQLFAVFIYPTLYWFITAILIFYIILFMSAKLLGSKTAAAVWTWRVILFMLFVLYLMLGDRQERLYVIGFFAMAAGYILREKISGFSAAGDRGDRGDRGDSKKDRIKMLVILIVCFAAFMVGELTDRAYVSKTLIFAGAIGTGISALMLGYYIEDGLASFFAEKKLLHSFICYVGGMALPLYLVQCFCSGYIGFWIGLHIDFPLSFLVNFIVVWTAGSLLYFVEKGLSYHKNNK